MRTEDLQCPCSRITLPDMDVQTLASYLVSNMTRQLPHNVRTKAVSPHVHRAGALWSLLVFCVLLVVSGPHRVHDLITPASVAHHVTADHDQHEPRPAGREHPRSECPFLYLILHAPVTGDTSLPSLPVLASSERFQFEPSIPSLAPVVSPSQARAPPESLLS